MYRWQGQVETEEELLLVMKTHRNHYVAIENTLKDIHPYEVPELLVFTIETGLPAYLAWLQEELMAH
jgi:periplasmic divalent cation tolerance protein